MENMENMIEFISGTRTATVTFTNQKHINRIKKIYEERKDDFKYFKENKDGSICAKLICCSTLNTIVLNIVELFLAHFLSSIG